MEFSLRYAASSFRNLSSMWHKGSRTLQPFPTRGLVPHLSSWCKQEVCKRWSERPDPLASNSGPVQASEELPKGGRARSDPLPRAAGRFTRAGIRTKDAARGLTTRPISGPAYVGMGTVLARRPAVQSRFSPWGEPPMNNQWTWGPS